MRVHLPRIGADRSGDIPVDEFERLAASDRFGKHELTPDPDAADVILFTQCHMIDWRLSAIREHPLAKRHWQKVMVYDERDRPWRSFPGVYVSTPSSQFDAASQRAWGYARTPHLSTSPTDPDLLFSFVGSATAPCRAPLFELRHPDAVVEESQGFMFWDSGALGFEAQRARYRDVLSRSRFVLCPRGRGTSSFRIYETLAAGGVPVIISDEWVPSSGPDWQACSLRWPEGSTDGLVEMLERRNREWPAMSAAASAAYRAFFAEDASFHSVVDLCSGLRDAAGEPASPARMRLRATAAALRQRAVGRE